MPGRSFAAVVLAAVCVTSSVCPFAEGTFHWFTSGQLPELSWGWLTPEGLPEMTLPEVCGTRVSVSNVTNFTLYSSTFQYLPPPPGWPEGVAFPGLDLSIPDGSFEPEFPWPWVVRVGDNAAGVLISQQHVVTLAHCLTNYTRWFGGFYSFSVSILDQEIEVASVQVQSTEENPLPFALLTLKSHNLTRVSSPVCVGPYRHELVAVAVGWDEAGYSQEQPVSIYRSGQCASFHEDNFKYDLMLCGSVGARLCGGPLLQLANGRWMLVGLASGEPAPIARYVRLSPARKWLEELK